MRANVQQMPRVFVSYRRDDTGQTAAALAALLRTHLSDEVVFIDRSDLVGGESWRDQLLVAATERDAVLCLIGPTWEGSAEGERRIDRTDDPVRAEIASALVAGVRAIPLLVDRRTMPAELPGDISRLREAHALPLRSSDYDADLAVLLATLWALRLRDLDPAHVVLTVGTVDVAAREFVEVIGRQYAPEVRVLTLAATGRMTLSMVEARTEAPSLFSLYLADDANERDRRVVAACWLPWHFDKVLIAGAGIPAGYTIAQLAAAPGRQWLAEALGSAGRLDALGGGVPSIEAVSASEASGATKVQVGRPRGLRRVRHAVSARPRAALLAGALTIGAAASVAVVAISDDDRQPPTEPPRAEGVAAIAGTWQLEPADVDDVELDGRASRTFDVAPDAPAVAGGSTLDLRVVDGCQLESACAVEVVEGPDYLEGAVLEHAGGRRTWGGRYSASFLVDVGLDYPEGWDDAAFSAWIGRELCPSGADRTVIVEMTLTTDANGIAVDTAFFDAIGGTGTTECVDTANLSTTGRRLS